MYDQLCQLKEFTERADGPVCPIVALKNEIEHSSVDQDVVCAVTRAMTRVKRNELNDLKDISSDKVCTNVFISDLSTLSFPVSAEEFWMLSLQRITCLTDIVCAMAFY